MFERFAHRLERGLRWIFLMLMYVGILMIHWFWPQLGPSVVCLDKVGSVGCYWDVNLLIRPFAPVIGSNICKVPPTHTHAEREMNITILTVVTTFPNSSVWWWPFMMMHHYSDNISLWLLIYFNPTRGASVAHCLVHPVFSVWHLDLLKSVCSLFCVWIDVLCSTTCLQDRHISADRCQKCSRCYDFRHWDVIHKMCCQFLTSAMFLLSSEIPQDSAVGGLLFRISQKLLVGSWSLRNWLEFF